MSMGAAIKLREDYDAAALRRLAGKAKDANQARRLLALAAVYDGQDREQTARVGGMDRQTLRNWVHRFNDKGSAGLIDVKAPGPAVEALWLRRKKRCAISSRTAPIRRRTALRAGGA